MNPVVLKLIVSTYTAITARVFIEYVDKILKYERYYGERYALVALGINFNQFYLNEMAGNFNGK